MGIEPIKRVNVGEQVFKQLKKMLIEGEWKQGDKLPSENALADLLRVSRITVRQALQRLGAMGLLETRLGEGSFVKVIDASENMQALVPTAFLSVDDIEQVFEFRQIIDVESVRLAAQRATKGDIEELREIHKGMMKLRDEMDPKNFSKRDTEFHFKICKMTGNTLIIKTNEILREVINSYIEKIIDKMGCATAIAYHGKIITAIEAGDEKGAVEIMREHLMNNLEYIEKIKKKL